MEINEFKDKKSDYKGFVIIRECVGRYGTSFRYRCGKYIAPRKKDVINQIDRVLMALKELGHES